MNSLDLLVSHWRALKVQWQPRAIWQMWKCRLSNNWWHWLFTRSTRRRAWSHLKWQAVTPLAELWALHCHQTQTKQRPNQSEQTVYAYSWEPLRSSSGIDFGGTSNVCLSLHFKCFNDKSNNFSGVCQKCVEHKKKETFQTIWFQLREQFNCTRHREYVNEVLDVDLSTTRIVFIPFLPNK